LITFIDLAQHWQCLTRRRASGKWIKIDLEIDAEKSTAKNKAAAVHPTPPYGCSNFLKDVAPVARLVRMVSLVVVHPSVSANTRANSLHLSSRNPGSRGL
jgi:hypothetical protein